MRTRQVSTRLDGCIAMHDGVLDCDGMIDEGLAVQAQRRGTAPGDLVIVVQGDGPLRSVRQHGTPITRFFAGASIQQAVSSWFDWVLEGEPLYSHDERMDSELVVVPDVLTRATQVAWFKTLERARRNEPIVTANRAGVMFGRTDTIALSEMPDIMVALATAMAVSDALRHDPAEAHSLVESVSTHYRVIDGLSVDIVEKTASRTARMRQDAGFARAIAYTTEELGD